ncbi:hypothetical protein YB2330_004271 [Saitoella coloradoensis]
MAEDTPGSESMPLQPRKRIRTNQACAMCRRLKKKCSGERPVCTNCAGYGYACIYTPVAPGVTGSDSHAAMVSTNTHLKQCLDLLRDLSERVDEADRTKIAQFLGEEPVSPTEERRFSTDSQQSPLENFSVLNDPNATLKDKLPPSAAAGTDIKGEIDAAGEKMTRMVMFDRDVEGTTESSKSPAGMIGLGSDLAFMRCTFRRLLLDQADPDGVYRSCRLPDYNLDDVNYDASPQLPDPYELPTKEVADRYVEVYSSTIHIAYPFICKSTFFATYDSLWSGATWDNTWLASFNMIIAIGAYYEAVQGKGPIDGVDHSVYFIRSRMLMNDIFELANLSMVQYELLASFYLLITNRVNRSWTVLGLAIRMGQSLGLNLDCSKAKGFTLVERETRSRCWYSCYVLERLLSLMLGRAPMIRDSSCAAQLPTDHEDDCFLLNGDVVARKNQDPSIVSYFAEMIRLSKVIGMVMDRLYPADLLSKQQYITRETITELDDALLKWKDELPQHLRFDLNQSTQSRSVFSKQRNNLGTKFHNLRCIINRPCLGYVEFCPPAKVSDVDRLSYLEGERICIAEARALIRMLEDLPNLQYLMLEFPWWQLLSSIMCACSVLLVANAISPKRPDHDALHADSVVCVKILEMLQSRSMAAQRCLDILRVLNDATPEDIFQSEQQTGVQMEPFESRMNSVNFFNTLPSVTLAPPSTAGLDSPGIMHTVAPGNAFVPPAAVSDVNVGVMPINPMMLAGAVVTNPDFGLHVFNAQTTADPVNYASNFADLWEENRHYHPPS